LRLSCHIKREELREDSLRMPRPASKKRRKKIDRSAVNDTTRRRVEGERMPSRRRRRRYLLVRRKAKLRKLPIRRVVHKPKGSHSCRTGPREGKGKKRRYHSRCMK